MPRRIVEYPTAQAAEGRQNALHNHMRATIPGYNAVQWSEVHIHPTQSGRFAITIKSRVRGGMTPAELNAEKDQEPDWEEPEIFP